MTAEEISRIKEHIEIHARREPASAKITALLWKAVEELEHIPELEREIFLRIIALSMLIAEHFKRGCWDGRQSNCKDSRRQRKWKREAIY